MLNTAKHYLNYGFSIFPIKPKSKKPYAKLLHATGHVKKSDPNTGSWKPMSSALPTLEHLNKWLQLGPRLNLAVATGRVSNITVVDLDIPDDPSHHTYTPNDFPPTLTARTGKGGYHLYYLYHAPIRCTTSTFAPAVDTKNDGGYVILPPSTHPNGNKYEWINKMMPAPFPITHPLFSNLDKVAKKTPEQWEELLLLGAPDKARNTSLAALTGKLLFHLAPHTSVRAVYSLLKGWNDLNSPPLTQEEFNRTFQSILSHHYGKQLADDDRTDRQES